MWEPGTGGPTAGLASMGGPHGQPTARPFFRELLHLAGSAGLTVLLLFLLWESVERQLAPTVQTAYLIHYARGISTSLVTACVIGWISFRQHRGRAAALEEEVARRTREIGDVRALLQVVVDNTPASLIVLDPDYRIVQANRLALEIHRTELVGRTCHEALHGSASRCPACAVQTVFATGEPATDRTAHTASASGEMLVNECHPLDMPGGRRYTLLVQRVVTEQRKLQAQLLHQEKMAAFGLLAAGIAHDLGNPVAAVDMQLQLLADRCLPEDTARPVAVVRQEVRRLQRILRELVDFARRRRDEATLVSVQAVVQDALSLLRHDRRMRGIEVQIDGDKETPPVHMIEDHLMQVTINILMNALDAMPDGGRLRVETRGVDGNVVLRIHDTGIGMDRKTLARCFEPLFTSKPPGKGTGLGLSICLDIVRAAGGDIEIHAARGRGTTVVVTLPAASPDLRAAQESP